VTTSTDFFWTEVQALASGLATTRREPDGSAELFVPAANGTLEITSDGRFVSVAWRGLFIEDRLIETQQEADFLLAVCDAVLAGRAADSGRVATATLTTRGCNTIWKSV
jgi:hypothetical protein